MLQFPPTIRLPHPEEMPHREDIHELLAKRKKARIVQGYKLEMNTTRQLPFNFLAQINVNNSRLWELFIALIQDFPDEVSCQYGLYEDEAITTDPFPKATVIQALSKYQKELTEDGTIAFGLLYHGKERLTEILVTAFKYIRYWGHNKESFIQCMNRFGIPSEPQLEFVDEYPVIVEPLKQFSPAAKRPEEVIRSLDRVFGIQRW